MVQSVLALVVRRVIALLMWPNEDAKDLEIVVLRHQLYVLPGKSAALDFGGAIGSCSPRSTVSCRVTPGLPFCHAQDGAPVAPRAGPPQVVAP
jgi:hypothetical protein